MVEWNRNPKHRQKKIQNFFQRGENVVAGGNKRKLNFSRGEKCSRKG